MARVAFRSRPLDFATRLAIKWRFGALVWASTARRGGNPSSPIHSKDLAARSRTAKSVAGFSISVSRGMAALARFPRRDNTNTEVFALLNRLSSVWLGD